MPDVSMPPWKIFLCHSSTEAPLLRELQAGLPSWLSVWLDEGQLRAGEHFGRVIEKAIRNEVRYFVVFYSKDAAKSPWVEQEVKWALEREAVLGREIVIPVLVRATATRSRLEIPSCLDGRLQLHLTDYNKESVQGLGRKLVEHITRLLIRDLQASEALHAKLSYAGQADTQPTARFWRRRSEFSSQDWKDLFASATKRIWLLGHSMTPAVNPEASGVELIKRLAAGLDLRLVVLDPVSSSNYQLHDIERQIAEPDLRGKIVRTLRFAEIIEKSAARQGNAGDHPRFFSVGVTEDVMHNSIVIVDDRFLITIYSHLYEMGDSGITMDLSLQQETEKDLCRFFEDEFLRTWRHSRPILDYQHQPLRVESRVYGYRDKVLEIAAWYDDASNALPPPQLAVIYPTYRCAYGPRSRHVKSVIEVPDGPYKDNLLCSNCMFGPVLNRKGIADMPVEQFSRLCDQLIDDGVNHIEIAGGGEPLHHRDAFNLIKVVRSKQAANPDRLRFGLLSNIAALSSCDFQDELLNGFSYIRWSWPESVELRSSLSQSYLSELRKIVQRKKDLLERGQLENDVRIGVKVLATKDNVAGERPPLVDLVSELVGIGIDHIKIRPIRSRTTSASGVGLRKAEDALLRLELALIRKGALSGSKTLEVDLRERFVQSRYRCKLSSLTSVVEPNGNLRICWNDVAPNEDRVIGNVFQDPFRDLWGSQRHRDTCHSTKADWVCNAEDGCHCRIVGYQDAAEKLLLAPRPQQTGETLMADGFV